MSAIHYDDLRGPWTTRPDPDGPTEIIGANGKVIGEVHPRFAGAIAEVPAMLSALAAMIDVSGSGCTCPVIVGRCIPCEVRDIFRKAGLL